MIGNHCAFTLVVLYYLSSPCVKFIINTWTQQKYTSFEIQNIKNNIKNVFMSLKCIAITHTTKLFCSEKVERRHMWSLQVLPHQQESLSRAYHTQIFFPCDKATKLHVQTNITCKNLFVRKHLWSSFCLYTSVFWSLSECYVDEILIYLMWAGCVQWIL